MRNHILSMIVFVVGFSVMVLEIVGARVLAPYVGTSIIVWTSLIGVVLGSLSLGYYLGGRLADNKPKSDLLFFLLISSGVLVLMTAYFKEIILSFIQVSITDLRVSSLVSSTILFGIPTIFLGMVTPYALRLNLRSVKKSGSVSGNLYALSTLGSILGTFVAGFYLLPVFGNTKILFFVSLTLILLSGLIILGLKQKIEKGIIITILLVIWGLCYKGGSNNRLGFLDIDTKYNRIILQKGVDPETQRPILSLIPEKDFVHSSIFTDNEGGLVSEYTKIFQLDNHFVPEVNNALAIGGAAYAFPMDFLERNENATMDVVEIDPGMTAIAEEYFNLKDNERLNIYHEDARNFLNRNSRTNEEIYDIVYIDAFLSSLAIPHQLTTKEAIGAMDILLKEEGVIFLNLVSALEGPGSKFLVAEYKTYKLVFPYVYVIPLFEDRDPARRQNLVLIAIKSKSEPSLRSADEKYDKYLSKILKNISMNMPILTDDYAPVEQYLLSIY